LRFTLDLCTPGFVQTARFEQRYGNFSFQAGVTSQIDPLFAPLTPGLGNVRRLEKSAGPELTAQ
jgi:hypothetical protein